MPEKKVAITTLGCKVNQYESTAMAEMFKSAGFQMVDFEDPADVYIINTCTVTHLGDRKSRQLIRRASRANPDGLVVVTGCYAQTSPGEVLEMPEVDLVVGTADKSRIVELVKRAVKGNRVSAVKDVFKVEKFEEMPVVANTGRVRAFLKIQEGCNNFCAYCIIPYARGALKSRKPENVLEEAEKLAAGGFKEIVLTGIHTGAYGQDLQGDVSLAGLLRRLASIPGLARLRLSSVEPMDFTEDLIEVFAFGPPLCRHIHIPLQSGDDTVLKNMRRHYSSEKFRNLVEKIRKNVPGVAITTDVIVGFPGETEVQFNNTYSFIKELGFAGMHVFKYSPRRGTPAADFSGQVEPGDKERRSRLLIELGEEMAADYARGFVHTVQEVLAEEYYDAGSCLYQGFTDNYLKVVFPGNNNLRGEIIKVNIEELSGTNLMGTNLIPFI